MARISLYDTTLRDGSQGEGISFSLQDKLNITKRLDEMGVDFIEGGYPLSNPKDFEYFQQVASLGLKHSQVSAFGMTRRKGGDASDDICLRALLEANTPIVTLVGKSWDLHVHEVLGTTLEENLAMIRDSIRYCKDKGRRVFYDAEHFFDGYAANPDYALATLMAAAEAGAEWLIPCDTNGGTMPDEIGRVISQLRRKISVPLGIHCHNDCELAVANSLAAIGQGATQIQGTINGIGERCGNADLISLIGNLGLKLGHEVLLPGSMERLTELSRFVHETANMNFRPNQPFVGPSAFAHKGGMHTHAIARLARSYEHIDPTLVGNEQRILVSELSGRATIIQKTEKLDLGNDKELMSRILNRIQNLENEGYEFEAAEASFELLVQKEAGLYTPHFEKLVYRVNIEAGIDGLPITEATVKLRVGNEIVHTVSEGDGPVNALDGALRKALVKVHPRVAEIHLADYKVRVVNARAGTAAKVRVVIESRDHDSVWTTVGVSENIVEASWLALVDSIDYKWLKDKKKKG